MRIQRKARVSWIGIAIAFAPLLCDVSAKESASMGDCYGYQVSDTAEIGIELQQRLKTVSDTDLIDIFVSFWTVPGRPLPDSCRDVHCPDQFDTLPRHFYRTWSRALFTDHELFDPLDTLHALVPEKLEVMPGYNMLLARKPTILALSKECYVEGMNDAIILVSVRKPGPKIPAERPLGRRYDALGRSPDFSTKPWVPKFGSPTYLMR